MPYSLNVRPKVSGSRVDGCALGDGTIENLVPVPWGPYNVRYIDGYTGNVTIRSNAGGTELLDLELAPADGETGMFLITRQGAVTGMQQVKLETAADGKRYLYVDEVAS